LLPREAPWLADFERELFDFPNGAHDDMVDAFTQGLAQLADFGRQVPCGFTVNLRQRGGNFFG